MPEAANNEKVKLNLLESTHFILCMDCALNLLLGDHAPLLTEAIAANGMTKANEEIYIKEASEFMKGVRETLEKSQATITNLAERPDWNSLLR